MIPLFLDIETVPNDSALALQPDPKPPSNYKDPEKIAKYIEEKKAQDRDKAALDFDFGMIAAVGAQFGTGGVPICLLVNDRRSEYELLSTLLKWIEKSRGFVAGYNIIGFDLPFIMRRAFALRLPRPTVIPNMSRYQSWPSIDLMQLLCNWDLSKAKPMKLICDLYGIENEHPELEGSQFSEMGLLTRQIYVNNEIKLLTNLYKRMEGYYL